MKLIRKLTTLLRPPVQSAPEPEPAAPAQEDPHRLLQEQSIVSGQAITGAIDAAISELDKFRTDRTDEAQDTPGTLTLDDQTLITERLNAMQAILGGTHADEDISELDNTLILSFQATLPYFFKYGKREDWLSALRQIRQAIDLRIGDGEQIAFAKIDLLILHCKAKDLYYSHRLQLSKQSKNQLHEERRLLAQQEASSGVDMEFDRITTSISTVETQMEIYERSRAANSIRLKDLMENKFLHEENRLSSGQLKDLIHRIINENNELMLTLGEQAVLDTQAVEEMLAKKKSTLRTVRRQLDDSKPTLIASVNEQLEEAKTLTHTGEVPEILLNQA